MVQKFKIFRSEQALSHSYKIGPDRELGVSYFLECRLTTKLTGLQVMMFNYKFRHQPQLRCISLFYLHLIIACTHFAILKSLRSRIRGEISSPFVRLGPKSTPSSAGALPTHSL